MAKQELPRHLRSCEIKRRLKAMLRAADTMGFEVGGVRLTAEGEITLLDKTTQPRDSKAEAEWLGG